MKHRFTLRLWSILLLAAGYGWAGGHFIPGDAPGWAYGFQFGMLLILFLLATGFLKAAAGHISSPGKVRRNIIGLSIYSILTLLINIANITRGFVQQGQYGSRNSFADLVPILLIITGDLLWLATALYHNRTAAVRN
jgi:hypothetical protein